MPVIGIREVLIRPSFKGSQQTISREMDGIADGAAEKAGRSAGGRMSSALGSALKVGALAAGAAAVGGLSLALTKGFGRLQAIENAQAKLTGLGHSAETVADIMANASAAVKGTAFGLGDAATAAAGAVASGVKPGQELEKTLQLVGDAATIAGVEYGDMAAIFNKIKAGDMIQGEELAQLGDAGIPILQLLGKELGKSAAEVRKLASEGKIDFATFSRAMEAGMGGAAQKSGETLQGAFNNTIAAVGRVGANLLTGIYPKIRDFFAGAIEWLKPLEEGAKVAGAVIGDVISNVLSAGKGVIDILFKGDFTGGIFGIQEDHPVVDFLFRVREGFMTLSGLLTGTAAILFKGDFVGSGIMGLSEDHPLVDFLFRVREGFLGLAEYVKNDLIPALRDFGGWVVQNKDWLLALTAGVLAGVAAFKAYLIVNSIVGAIKAYSVATSIATAKAWLLNTALLANPVGLVIAGIAALVAGLVWFFTQTELGQQIVQNVWAAIQSFVGGTVAWFQTYVLPTIQAVFNAVGAVFSWLWTNIVSPVFGFIAGAVKAFWMVASYIFNLLVAVIQKVVGPAIQALYNTFVKPMFDAIGAVISWVWNNVLKPIFDGWVWMFNNVLGPAFKWLYETIIKPAFDGIGSAIKWVWDNVLKPVFDAIGTAINETLPNAFKKGIELIEVFWNGLKKVVRAPIDFVINKVINEGLIGGLNSIGSFLQLDPLPTIPQLAEFAEGGYTGPGGKYQPAGIVHAGEVVWSQADIARWGGVGVVEALRKAVGYAKGGLVHPLRQSTVSQPFSGSHNGMDFAAPTGTPIGAAGPGRVSSAGWSSYGGGNEIHIDHPNGLQTWYAHLSSFAVKMGDMVRASQLIGQVGSTGKSTGPHLHYMVLNGGWPNYVNPSSYLEGGGEPGSGGWNPVAGIVDGLVESFKKAFPAAGFVADLAIGAGKKLLDGAVGFVTGKGGKDDGIGETRMPYLYDNGGVLNPGLTQVLNNSRKPEAIYTNRQNSALQALAARGAAPGSDHQCGGLSDGDRLVLDFGSEQVIARIASKGVHQLTRGKKVLI